jgi:hypothetical protein
LFGGARRVENIKSTHIRETTGFDKVPNIEIPLDLPEVRVLKYDANQHQIVTPVESMCISANLNGYFGRS